MFQSAAQITGSLKGAGTMVAPNTHLFQSAAQITGSLKESARLAVAGA